MQDGCSIINNIEQLPYTPVVVALGEDLFSHNRFYVVVEHVPLFEDVQSFSDTIMLMFAAYFVFNIGYPKEVGASLEFIENHIMNLGAGKR
ncbi:uncharacterized protein LOC135383368 [Ornithodoros turicata]|uniref:uncharacterized protein LOC135383368 n=1 Tax=Ornithodoros turicata TaxID=34597 RepID=UPI00313A15CC